MKSYDDKKGMGAMGEKDHDYQPGEKQFAGAMMGKTNQYMERTDKHMDKAASQIKKQSFSGNRYD